MQSQSTDDNDTATLGVVVVKERISITHESHNNTLRMFVDMKLSSSFMALNNHDPVGAYETRTTPPTTHTPIVISTHSPTIIIAEISPPRITTILVLMLPRSAQ